MFQIPCIARLKRKLPWPGCLFRIFCWQRFDALPIGPALRNYGNACGVARVSTATCPRPSGAPGARFAVIVLDASAAIEWLLKSPTGIKIDKRIFSHSESLHAPHLLDIEVAQVLRRYVREKMITGAARARSARRSRGLAARALSARFPDSSCLGAPRDANGIRCGVCGACGATRRPSADLRPQDRFRIRSFGECRGGITRGENGLRRVVYEIIFAIFLRSAMKRCISSWRVASSGMRRMAEGWMVAAT